MLLINWNEGKCQAVFCVTLLGTLVAEFLRCMVAGKCVIEEQNNFLMHSSFLSKF